MRRRGAGVAVLTSNSREPTIIVRFIRNNSNILSSFDGDPAEVVMSIFRNSTSLSHMAVRLPTGPHFCNSQRSALCACTCRNDMESKIQWEGKYHWRESKLEALHGESLDKHYPNIYVSTLLLRLNGCQRERIFGRFHPCSKN